MSPTRARFRGEKDPATAEAGKKNPTTAGKGKSRSDKSGGNGSNDPAQTLVLLLQLQNRVSRCTTLEATQFFLVNELHRLMPYRQAILWRRISGGRGEVVALSGLPELNREAPFVVWLEGVLAEIAKKDLAGVVDPGALPEKQTRQWSQWLPEKGYWLPLTLPWGDTPGGLLLTRAEPWAEAEGEIWRQLAPSLALAWWGHLSRRGRWRRGWEGVQGSRLGWLVALGVIALLCLPVTQSVMAPAEVVAHNPVLIRAPMEGVIDQLHVEPHQAVDPGTLLISLDGAQLQNRLQVAKREWEVARTEYAQAMQKAVRDVRSKSRLTLLKKRLEQRQADRDYLEARLQRLEIRAPRSGIALFTDINDWLGKPVVLGEGLFLLADPREVEMEIQLPVADAITLTPGARTALFLNTHPGDPLPGRLRHAAYEARPTAEGVLSYRLLATFDPPTLDEATAEGATSSADATPFPPRIGLRGSARIYDGEASLFHYLLRRPLALLWRWLGV
ncbi:MAG: HlyD family efflux transporter periplasmic adaptor subunit [Magnetococcales bacterium]|nr:HlyD family efflux transporter periplasmic adaptor subunit [Magnetococcales bacterium]